MSDKGASTWAKGWGEHHTSDVIDLDCPQGCARRHSVDEAYTLNEKDREYRRAAMHARNKEWMGVERRR